MRPAQSLPREMYDPAPTPQFPRTPVSQQQGFIKSARSMIVPANDVNNNGAPTRCLPAAAGCASEFQAKSYDCAAFSARQALAARRRDKIVPEDDFGHKSVKGVDLPQCDEDGGTGGRCASLTASWNRREIPSPPHRLRWNRLVLRQAG